jgi:polyribonucleotide nucleotidyltransferase
MSNIIRKTFKYGKHDVTLETGRIAKQADGAVLVTMGDTVVLATVVGQKVAGENQGFFPLTVQYQEKTSAAGKIPGGYFKREGRPSEYETLTSRLIDRPLRPLFPKSFYNEVQTIITVFSFDPEVQPDIPAMLGASAALSISGIPFNGPIGAVRVGYNGSEYSMNPSFKDVESSQLDLVVAGTKHAILMVESEAKVLSEEVMLNALTYGHEQIKTAVSAIEDFASQAGKPKWDWTPPVVDDALVAKVKELAYADLNKAFGLKEKLPRYQSLQQVRDNVVEKLCEGEQVEGETPVTAGQVIALLHDLEAEILRSKILKNEPRVDGRDNLTVRPISIDIGLLPRTHGSSLFTRGETQALTTITLGTEKDAQFVDNLTGEQRDPYMLHYNFPPFCVGETGFLGSPKRREIGHGKLAKRATSAVLPSVDKFPYVIRVTTDITEANGSSSMATVCGTTLALMDAGVPIKAPVAGIAMGLIKEGEQFFVLTDIMGDEDHLGDMDFKVAGTHEGITALQMDIKIDGITPEIVKLALAQAKDGRMHILDIMKKVIAEPRALVSPFAPRITTMKINPDKIRDVIGKGGAVIRELTESTNTSIDIDDDGTIKIAAINSIDSEAARRRIEELTAEPVIGQVYEGPIVKLTDFGAFVRILPNCEGMVHISQIKDARVRNIYDELREGQIVRVKVIEIDRNGRIRLTMKNI